MKHFKSKLPLFDRLKAAWCIFRHARKWKLAYGSIGVKYYECPLCGKVWEMVEDY